MALESSGIRGVKTWYGVQDLGQSEDTSVRNVGAMKEKVVAVTAGDYASVSFVLPKGASLVDSFVEVTEAFVLGGTTPTIAVGTSSSEVTNSIVEIAEADAEAIGTYAGVLAGTMTAPLASDTTIAVALGGTTPTITSVGKAFVHFRYSIDNR